ncbi:MAG TPA: hypothetical protein VJJ22_02575 [Candidatus Paceibacterota bacterium]
MNTIVREKSIDSQLRDFSRSSGIPKKEIVNRAILLFLDQTRKSFELNQELMAWDLLSDEVTEALDKKLALK